MLRDQSVWMPYQWFMRNGSVMARVWGMESVPAAGGWIVREDHAEEVALSQFLLPFEILRAEYDVHGILDPTRILGAFIKLCIRCE